MRLLIATTNPGKVREYQQLLNGLDCELVSLPEVGIMQEVSETGSTYEENALLKARNPDTHGWVEYREQEGFSSLDRETQIVASRPNRSS